MEAGGSLILSPSPSKPLRRLEGRRGQAQLKAYRILERLSRGEWNFCFQGVSMGRRTDGRINGMELREYNRIAAVRSRARRHDRLSKAKPPDPPVKLRGQEFPWDRTSKYEDWNKDD
jgi:hypothetical protein